MVYRSYPVIGDPKNRILGFLAGTGNAERQRKIVHSRGAAL